MQSISLNSGSKLKKNASIKYIKAIKTTRGLGIRSAIVCGALAIFCLSGVYVQAADLEFQTLPLPPDDLLVAAQTLKPKSKDPVYKFQGMLECSVESQTSGFTQDESNVVVKCQLSNHESSASIEVANPESLIQQFLEVKPVSEDADRYSFLGRVELLENSGPAKPDQVTKAAVALLAVKLPATEFVSVVLKGIQVDKAFSLFTTMSCLAGTCHIVVDNKTLPIGDSSAVYQVLNQIFGSAPEPFVGEIYIAYPGASPKPENLSPLVFLRLFE